MLGRQQRPHRVLLVVRRPAADTLGQGRRGQSRDHAQPQLQRPHARLAEFQALVDAALQFDRTEQRADAVRRLVAAAVGLAAEANAGRTLCGGRFGVVVGVRDYLTSGLFQQVLDFFSKANVAAGVGGCR